MTIVASNSLTVSNVNDGTITHTAYAYSADGTDRFTTVYPNLNLLDGTKDFSGTWTNSSSWVTDGTYKGLTVKKRTGQWNGIYKTFTAPKDGVYTFSAYVKGTGTETIIYSVVFINGVYTNSLRRTWTSSFDWTRDIVTINLKANDVVLVRYEIAKVGTNSALWNAGHKWEPGSTATPYMGSSSEVTSSDWPSYIGQYTDFTSTASTDPAKYAPWTIFKGNDGKDGVNGKDGIAGKDGVGIKTTDITYAISTSGTTAPTTGWTSSVPSLIKGQYLWTKTVWTYTDNSSETGYSVTYISKDGNNGNDGIAGKDGTGIKTTTITYAGSTSGTTAPTSGWTSTVPTVAAGSYLWTKTVWAYTDNTSETGYSVAKMGNDGSNGDPGKVVSDTEPTTRFKGLTWKYSGTTDLTASDGTVILSGTEYYWSGTKWTLNEINAHNINGNNLKITDGAFVSTVTNGPVTTSTEIKDNHIAISKTDGTVNTKNDIALDSEQGLAQKFTNISTGFNRTAGINFQGPFTSDSDGNYAQLTPQGTKLSTDVPWTDITRASGVGTSGTLRARINNGVFYAQSKDVTIPSIAPNSIITIGTMPSKFSGVSGFDTLGLLYSPGQLSVASVTVGNDGKINIGNPNSTTMSGKVIQFSINIPLG